SLLWGWKRRRIRLSDQRKNGAALRCDAVKLAHDPLLLSWAEAQNLISADLIHRSTGTAGSAARIPAQPCKPRASLRRWMDSRVSPAMTEEESVPRAVDISRAQLPV